MRLTETFTKIILKKLTCKQTFTDNLGRLCYYAFNFEIAYTLILAVAFNVIKPLVLSTGVQSTEECSEDVYKRQLYNCSLVIT